MVQFFYIQNLGQIISNANETLLLYIMNMNAVLSSNLLYSNNTFSDAISTGYNATSSGSYHPRGGANTTAAYNMMRPSIYQRSPGLRRKNLRRDIIMKRHSSLDSMLTNTGNIMISMQYGE